MIEITNLNFSRFHRAASRLTIAGFLAMLLAGCGGVSNEVVDKVPVYEVKGSVVLSSGKPLDGGSIEFVPSSETARPAVGVVAADGTFTLKTGGIGDGAAEGRYKVKIEPDYAGLKLPKKGKVAKAYPFAMKYLEEDTSGLVATIKPVENNLEPFTLKDK